ncbi:unnamed protein product [Prunus armeniaca]|uniref:Uncharacterized protein n=1 Tax=Prunus armeniaca TaxID=36596 RepID=A0A6J5WVF4_PRUAR|nr:unnamed protein product [Prunus armeniaca]
MNPVKQLWKKVSSDFGKIHGIVQFAHDWKVGALCTVGVSVLSWVATAASCAFIAKAQGQRAAAAAAVQAEEAAAAAVAAAAQAEEAAAAAVAAQVGEEEAAAAAEAAGQAPPSPPPVVVVVVPLLLSSYLPIVLVSPSYFPMY